MPAKRINQTATAEHLARISTWDSRSRGGIHCQHILQHHYDVPNPKCDLCRVKTKGAEPEGKNSEV